MRTKKSARLLALSLVLILAALCCSPLQARALPPSGGLTLWLESGDWYDTAAGRAVDVTLSAEANPGLCGFDVALGFDKNFLTAVRATAGVISNWNAAPDCDWANDSGSLKLLAAQADNVEQSGKLLLFTVTFVRKAGAVGPSGLELNLSFRDDSGFIYTYQRQDGKTVIPSLTVDGDHSVRSVTLLLDGLGAARTSEDTLTLSGGAVSGTAAAKLTSCGSGYSGSALAVLSCYQGGRLLGAETKPVTVAANTATSVSFENVSFTTASGGGEATAKMFLLHPDTYAPLTDALTWSFNEGDIE